MAALVRYCTRCKHKLSAYNPDEMCGACVIAVYREEESAPPVKPRRKRDRCEGYHWFSGLRCIVSDAHWNGTHYACSLSREACILPSSSDDADRLPPYSD